jgi:hypothetical protein
MTEVLSPSPTPGINFPSAPLRRNVSQQLPDVDSDNALNLSRRYSNSLSSSAPSSPRLASQDLFNFSSCASTPSSLSLPDTPTDKENELQFPSYYVSNDLSSDDDVITPSNSSPTNAASRDDVRELDSFSFERFHKNLQSVGDDLDITDQPSRHVDYLSHEWREEDVWSSWRHIVGKRRVLENWERLENAAWRTWAKSRSKLDVVSPEKLNWLVSFFFLKKKKFMEHGN